MNIRIEKKTDNKFLLLFGNDEKVEGLVLSKSDISKLKNNLVELVEYDKEIVGDNL